MEKLGSVGRVVVWFIAFVLVLFSGSALAGRGPCSGSHGGVARCDGESFVCVDGAVSQSKKSCQASEYANSAPVEDVAASAPVAVASAPEKSSYTIISWVVGVFVVFVVGLITLVFLVVRWLLRWFRRQRAEAVKA